VTKYVAQPYVAPPPPPPTIPKFVRGGAGRFNGSGTGPFSQGTGEEFTTAEPFTVEDYALGRNLTVEVAQAVLDQAVADGDVLVV
jgi:hypothetical protein